LQVHGGLPGGLVLCVQEGESLGVVFGAQAGLFAGDGILAVENAGSPEQDESLFRASRWEWSQLPDLTWYHQFRYEENTGFPPEDQEEFG
jgi:hypothetical protein